jgi:hypothetical protein
MRDYADLRSAAQTLPMVSVTAGVLLDLLDELDRLRAAAKPGKAKRNDYPAPFEEVWAAYPERPGMSKPDAYKAWIARINAGATPSEMMAGVQRYAAYVKANRTEPQYIKQPVTFFGPGEHYRAAWAVTAAPPGRPVVGKFSFAGADRTGDRQAQSAALQRRGVVIPDGEIEL